MYLLILPLFGVVLFALSPVLVPAVMISGWRDARRLSGALKRPCLRCGEPLGRAAREAGDAAWHAQLAEFRRLHPYSRFRIVRHVDAVCPSCATPYRLDGDRLVIWVESR